MIAKKLDEINEIIDKLIDLTNEDITHIKEAKHGGVMASVESKNKLIEAFYAAKKLFDNEVFRLSEGGDEQKLSKILGENKEKMNKFKEKLRLLQEKNKEYAKLVLVVKNYFDGLLSTLFDEGAGSAYNGKIYAEKKANFNPLFKIKV